MAKFIIEDERCLVRPNRYDPRAAMLLKMAGGSWDDDEGAYVFPVPQLELARRAAAMLYGSFDVVDERSAPVMLANARIAECREVGLERAKDPSHTIESACAPLNHLRELSPTPQQLSAIDAACAEIAALWQSPEVAAHRERVLQIEESLRQRSAPPPETVPLDPRAPIDPKRLLFLSPVFPSDLPREPFMADAGEWEVTLIRAYEYTEDAGTGYNRDEEPGTTTVEVITTAPTYVTRHGERIAFLPVFAKSGGGTTDGIRAYLLAFLATRPAALCGACSPQGYSRHVTCTDEIEAAFSTAWFLMAPASHP